MVDNIVYHTANFCDNHAAIYHSTLCKRVIVTMSPHMLYVNYDASNEDAFLQDGRNVSSALPYT